MKFSWHIPYNRESRNILTGLKSKYLIFTTWAFAASRNVEARNRVGSLDVDNSHNIQVGTYSFSYTVHIIVSYGMYICRYFPPKSSLLQIGHCTIKAPPPSPEDDRFRHAKMYFSRTLFSPYVCPFYFILPFIFNFQFILFCLLLPLHLRLIFPCHIFSLSDIP